LPEPSAPTTQKLPDFAQRLRAQTEDERKDALKTTHADYDIHVSSWSTQLDAFEGGGGFLNGDYIWPFPSESEGDFDKRQKMARYHNYVETLVDLYVRFMYTQGVKRTSSNEDYNAWTEDVDGAGTSLTEYLKRFAAVSLVNGHGGTLIDKTPEEATGPSKADEKARVFVTLFPATSIVDWRFDRNTLVGVKLIEAAPDTDLIAAKDADESEQWLLWDTEGWARFKANSDLISGDVPNLGLVPLIILRPKPSTLSLMLGRALVPNANVVKALFNRSSEEDHVLRSQAFSQLVVNVPADGDVNRAREQLGTTMGAAKALVAQGDIKYITPDQSVPGAIRENISYLVQEIYRAAHMRFRRDSLASETAEAIRLQYAELNEMLQGFAKALAQAEKDIARAWFAWMHPTPDAAQKAFDAAQVQAEYPDEFFLDALMTELEAWAEAIRMDLGDTMTRRIKKRAVRRIEPDMPIEELEAIDKEIDALPVERLSAQPMDLGGSQELPQDAAVN
jgi:hypothetical protein